MGLESNDNKSSDETPVLCTNIDELRGYYKRICYESTFSSPWCIFSLNLKITLSKYSSLQTTLGLVVNNM